MPKELARVMAGYGGLQNRVSPLLSELTSHAHDYILMKDRLSVFVDQLAEQLKDLGVKTAADPRAAKNNAVLDTLEEIDKSRALMEDREDNFAATAKKVDAIRLEVLALQKDVVAVVKAKSGFFSTSKSRPQLNALSTTLLAFAGDLQTATRLDY